MLLALLGALRGLTMAKAYRANLSVAAIAPPARKPPIQDIHDLVLALCTRVP